MTVVARVPVLWVSGPAGAGKTTVAWEIYAELTRSGADVGYVDIDQLGMCFPERGRHRIAAGNLASVVAGYRSAGARAVVVSGVVDPERGIDRELLPGIALTVCRLRAEAGELRARLTGRRADAAYIERAVAEAEVLDAAVGDELCVDTTGLGVEQVVALVRERSAGWMDVSSTVEAADTSPGPDPDGEVLWLCGATGVGKSTVGFTFLLRHVLGAGQAGAFVDLDQIGFYRTAVPGHPMRARILADMWRTFRAVGAERLVMVGPAEDDAAVATYARALPAATITVCQLRAGPEELARRIMLRGRGGSWAQPGDPLKGQSDAYLAAVARRAAVMDRLTVGDVQIDTDQLTVEQVADAVAEVLPKTFS